MTEGMMLPMTLAGAGLCLAGLGLAGLFVSRAQQERQREAERLAAVVSPHLRQARTETVAFVDAVVEDRQTPLRMLAGLFGFDPQKSALYPIKWWIVLGAAFGIAFFSRTVTGEFLGSWSVVSVPVLWVGLCRGYFSWIENRRRSQLLQQFPDALALIVRAIRVGIPVLEAVRIVARELPGPTDAEFAKLVDQVAIGASLEDAVADLARRTGLPEYRFFATALALQNQTGGTLSDTLENLADVIRKRAALKARGKALTAEARASAMILAVLPVLTGLILYLTNPSYIMVLFTEPSGRSMLGFAVISLGLGLLLIRTIIRRSLPR